MPADATQRAPARTDVAATIVKSAAKLAALVAFAGLLVVVVFNAGVQPDRQGYQAMRDGHPLVGAWLGDWPSDEQPLIQEFRRTTGTSLDLVDVFLDWWTPVDNVTHTIQHVSRAGAIPILTWEPQGITTQDILQGSMIMPLRDDRRIPLDAYLDEFAVGVCDAAERTRQPVIVRTMHEMNGGWFHWGLGYEDEDGNRPNSPDSYKAAWIKIHDAFEEQCPGDVLMLWAVNHDSGDGASSHTDAFPGDAYVDLVGLDGYNWGDNAAWGWKSFHHLFAESYCAVTAVTTRPILIAETASSERGGDKAAWIRELFAHLDSPAYPRLDGVVWLHHAKYEREINGPMDWQITSSPAALDAFSDGAKELQAVRYGDDDRSTAGPERAPRC